MIATASGRVSASYAYDPLDRRTKKTVNGSVFATYFLDSGADEVGEYAAAGTLLRRYIPSTAVDHPLAMIDYTQSGNPKTFFHQDKTGSVIAMSDTSGNVAAGPWTYDPYGMPSSAAGEPYKFDGMRFDTETGCYYDRARYYCPTIGRFLQTDPVGYADDVDWYTYVGNDPTDKTDPTGKTCTTDPKSGAVIACQLDGVTHDAPDGAKMQRYLRSWTRGVRDLQAGDPNRSVPIPVDGQTMIMTAGAAAKNMISRNLVYDSNPQDQDSGAGTAVIAG